MTQPTGKIQKILIVEDDRLDQKAITKVLAELPQYQYTLAASLKEAREKLREATFDLLLLDFHLPDGNSEELFNELAGAPFVMTAGMGSEEIAVRAYKAGASDYLIKDPDRFYLKLLLSTIEKALKKRELEQLKENFIGTVSHELRTPITIIGMGLDNLKAGILGPLSEKQALAIERNIRNAKHLGRMIDNLLDLSRLESGRSRIEGKEVDLKHLIHEVIQNFEPAGKEGGAKICEEVAVDLPHLECDPDLISQVLTNLLGNAIRYAKEKIVVKVNNPSAPPLNVRGGEGGVIQISVANDGPGIPVEKLGKLFQKFVQLDRAERKTTYKGTGLGLAICKEIIERHKGKIWVESDGKKGVKFYFTLPVDLRG